MNAIKKILRYIVYHVMAGSTFYLATIACGFTTISPTPQHALQLFLMFALIGLLTITLTELQSHQFLKIPFLGKIFLHFVSTFLIIAGTSFIFNWHFAAPSIVASFIWGYLINYPVVWLALYFYWWLTARKINVSLRSRQANFRSSNNHSN